MCLLLLFNTSCRSHCSRSIIIGVSHPLTLNNRRSFRISFYYEPVWLHTNKYNSEWNRDATPHEHRRHDGHEQLHLGFPHLSIKVIRIRPRPRPSPGTDPGDSRILLLLLLLLRPRRLISLIATGRRSPHPTTRRSRVEDGIRILQVGTRRLRWLMGYREIVPLAGTEWRLLSLIGTLCVSAGRVV